MCDEKKQEQYVTVAVVLSQNDLSRCAIWAEGCSVPIGDVVSELLRQAIRHFGAQVPMLGAPVRKGGKK